MMNFPVQGWIYNITRYLLQIQLKPRGWLTPASVWNIFYLLLSEIASFYCVKVLLLRSIKRCYIGISYYTYSDGRLNPSLNDIIIFCCDPLRVSSLLLLFFALKERCSHSHLHIFALPTKQILQMQPIQVLS